MVVEVIQREIPTRSLGYIILRDCPEERLGEALGKGMEKLKKAGAATVWATSLPEGEPLHAGPVGVWRLTHVQDTVELTRDLTQGRAKPELRLSLRPPRKAQEDSILMDLINRSYREVPGAVSLRSTGLRLPNHRYGLAWQGEQPVGAYIADLNDSKIPELTYLAVEPTMRRQGVGRSILRPVVRETTALGAAYLAGLAVGVWRSREEIRSQWTLDRRFDPAVSQPERERLLTGWHRAVERAKGWEEGP